MSIKEIDRIQKAWDKEVMSGPCHYCSAKKNIQILLSFLESKDREIEELKRKTFIPSILKCNIHV